MVPTCCGCGAIPEAADCITSINKVVHQLMLEQNHVSTLQLLTNMFNFINFSLAAETCLAQCNISALHRIDSSFFLKKKVT
jgi:hypothetical protein